MAAISSGTQPAMFPVARRSHVDKAAPLSTLRGCGLNRASAVMAVPDAAAPKGLRRFAYRGHGPLLRSHRSL